MSDLPGNAAVRPAKIEVYRQDYGPRTRSPYRVMVDGVLLLTLTGRIRRFGSRDVARRAALNSLKSGARS